MSRKGMTRRELLVAGGNTLALAYPVAALPGAAVAAGAGDTRVLRYAVNDFGNNNLDPQTGSKNLIFLCGMFDGAFPQDINTGKLKPGVVDKWEMSTDGTVWTFSLNKNVVFHDGSKFTSADFVFSLNRAQKEDAYQYDVARKMWGYPLKADVIDDYTIKVTTPAPSPRLITTYSNLTTPHLFMLPKAYIEKNGYEYFLKNPVGTGAYKFVSFTQNQSLEYQAVDYPHWTGIVPDFKRVVISMVPEETTRMLLLQKGQIDGTNASVQAAVDAKAKGNTVLTGAGGLSQMNFIGMFMPEAKNSPFADVRVREALSLAINRQEIVDTLLGGLGGPPRSQQALNLRGDDVSPWLAEKWEPRMKQLWRYDVDAAKKLLADAGHAGGFNADVWSAPDPDAPFLADIVVAIAAYWSQIGVNANIVSVDSAAWVANRRPPKSMQLVGKAGASATSLAKPVAMDRLQYFTSNGGVLNLFVGSPDQQKIDDIYNVGEATVDMDAYTKYVDQGLELTTPTYTCLSIIEAAVPVVIGPRVQAAMAPGNTYVSAWFPYWKYTGKEP